MRKVFLFFTAVTLLAASIAGARIGGGDITFKLNAGNVVYSHDFHVGQKRLKCSECHYRLYTTIEKHNKVTMADMRKGMSCGACHNGERAFDVKGNCAKCHTG